MRDFGLEAIELGWLPGHWPARLTYEGIEYTRIGVMPGIDCCQEDTYIYGIKETETHCYVSGDHLDPGGLGWGPWEWPLTFEDLDGTRYERGEMVTQDPYPNSETKDFLGYEYMSSNGDIVKIYHDSDSDQEESE
jgi:hypothetical protein